MPECVALLQCCSSQTAFPIPEKYFYILAKYERYIMLGLFALIMFGAFDRPLAWLNGIVFNALDRIAALPFRWL